MIALAFWQMVLLGVTLLGLATLLVVWWRQQSLRWASVLAVGIISAVALSWWAGIAFKIPDYRAGCDGLCPGYRGAPFPIFRGEAAGGAFRVDGFLLNVLTYFLLFKDGLGQMSVDDFVAASDVIFSESEMALLSGIISFWFGSRQWGKK